MELRIFTEPQQGGDYDDLLAIAKATEDLGFDGFVRSDHYLRMGKPPVALPGLTDAWTTLAGLARETSRIRLGTLVSSMTFRHPGVLAVQVAQVDRMSGGRVELGLGAGWYEAEHAAYGIPFPRSRFSRLEEQLEIITGIWGTAEGDTFDFDGKHYQLKDCPAVVKPAQSRLPLIIGGAGRTRTPALAARFATEFNIPFHPVADTGAAFERVRAAAVEHDRKPDEIVMSAAHVACVGANSAELERRAGAIGRKLDDLRTQGLTGSPAEVVDKLGRYAEVGTTRAYLQILDLTDLAHLELIASQVLPQLG
jgi:F420-dependent oxidoreductase-like protein